MAQEEQNCDQKGVERLVETLATLPQLNPNPILIVDFSGKVAFHNDAAAKIVTSLGLADLAGFLPEDLLGIINSAKQGQETWFYREVRLGDRIFAEDLHADNTIMVLLVYAVEITELKAAQEELKRHREHLEESVRQATAALGEREEQFRAVVESVTDGIISMDTSGNVVFWNKGAQTIFGYPRAEALGRPVTLLMSENSQEAYSRALERLRTRGESRLIGKTAELQGRRKDGSEFPLELALSSYQTGQGTFFSAVGRDISPRQQAEAELQRLRHHQELLLNSVWEGILGLDANESITFVNQAAAKMLGYEVEELLGRHSHSIYHHSKADGSPYPAEDCPIYAAIRESAPCCSTNEIFWRRDGTSFPVEYSVAPLVNGVTNGAVVTFWDISRRQEAESLARSLIETSPVGVYLLQDRKFVLTNHWFHIITCYSDADMADLDFWDLVHPDDRFAVRANALMMLRGESFTPYEYRHLNKGGETRWIMETVTPIRYKGKRATLGYFMDITERKQLEDKLLHAQKMEAVGRLAGGVAHDFNNMLTAIMGYAELILGRLGPGDPILRQVQGIRKAADRAAALTRQLLAFSRKQILQPQVLNLNVVVKDTQDMLRRLIGEDIELVTVLDPALGNIKADMGQIEQVILNVAVNARDAMPKGGKLSFVTANVSFNSPHDCQFEVAPPGRYAMLAVSDTGVGMEAEMLDHLFEPFYTTKEVGKGTGLGLSTVYGIVKQSGGCIEVQSQPGTGTTFKIYFSRVAEAVATEATAPPTKLEGSETILLVEDEDTVRQLIADALARYGYRVLAARDGAEAQRLCEGQQGPIHLMLTDVVMPQMSGRDLAERLAPGHPEMKVLYMSGYSEDIISHRGILEEGTLFLQKPFTPAILAQKVRTALEARLVK